MKVLWIVATVLAVAGIAGGAYYVTTSNTTVVMDPPAQKAGVSGEEKQRALEFHAPKEAFHPKFPGAEENSPKKP